MTGPDDFDARLAARFEQEHPRVSADAFVAATMRKIRQGRRRHALVRNGVRAAALGAVIAASPWLISGVEKLDAAVRSSLTLAEGLPGLWLLGVLVVAAVVALRVRGR